MAKAQNQAWIEFGSATLVTLFQLTISADNEALESKSGDQQLSKIAVEAIFGDGSFFNGSDWSLVDSSRAPLAMRLAIVESMHRLGVLDDLPKVRTWFVAMSNRESVQKSVVSELTDLYRDFIRSLGAVLAG